MPKLPRSTSSATSSMASGTIPSRPAKPHPDRLKIMHLFPDRPLVPLLPSTSSAAGCPTLFAGFAGTISESDFFAPFIIGDGLRPSRCGPEAASQGGDKEFPVPAQEVYVHAEGLKRTRGG